MASRKKLPRTFEKLEASLNKLNEALSPNFESKYEREILTEIVTKRFEYTFESLWKHLRELLLSEGIEANSPLGCFREAYQLGYISSEDENVFPLMVKKRNEIVHIYSDDEAFEIYLLIKNTFVTAINRLFNKIKSL